MAEGQSIKPGLQHIDKSIIFDDVPKKHQTHLGTGCALLKVICQLRTINANQRSCHRNNHRHNKTRYNFQRSLRCNSHLHNKSARNKCLQHPSLKIPAVYAFSYTTKNHVRPIQFWITISRFLCFQI